MTALYALGVLTIQFTLNKGPKFSILFAFKGSDITTF